MAYPSVGKIVEAGSYLRVVLLPGSNSATTAAFTALGRESGARERSFSPSTPAAS